MTVCQQSTTPVGRALDGIERRGTLRRFEHFIRAATPVGLVTDTISHQQPYAQATVTPGALVVRRQGRKQLHVSDSQRGVITDLSRRSRRRLIEHAARIDFDAHPAYFQTLTYHERAPSAPDAWHRHLDLYCTALARQWARWRPSILWKQEVQRRGAIHFHLIIVWQREPQLECFRAWSDARWNGIAEPGDDVALRVGVSTLKVRRESKHGARRLMGYIAKYIGKGAQCRRLDKKTGEILPAGRWWGVRGPLPQLESPPVDLSYGEYQALTRLVRDQAGASKYRSRCGWYGQGFLLYNPPDASVSLLREMHTGNSAETLAKWGAMPPPGLSPGPVPVEARTVLLDRLWWREREASAW